MGWQVPYIWTGLGHDYCKWYPVMYDFLPNCVIYAWKLPTHTHSLLADVKQYPNLIRTLCFLLNEYKPKENISDGTVLSISGNRKFLHCSWFSPIIMRLIDCQEKKLNWRGHFFSWVGGAGLGEKRNFFSRVAKMLAWLCTTLELVFTASVRRRFLRWYNCMRSEDSSRTHLRWGGFDRKI